MSHFFRSFFTGQQNTQKTNNNPNYMKYNEGILEIINNWIEVNNLMKKYKKGEIKEVDQLEHSWYNFLIGNNIDITLYKNEEEFLNIFWKIPEE